MSTTIDAGRRRRRRRTPLQLDAVAAGSTTGTRTTRRSGSRPARRSPARTSSSRSSPSTSASASGCCGRSSSSTSPTSASRMSIAELFLLTAVPNLIGSFLRIPYTFAVPRFGGRAWTTISASLLLIPTLAAGVRRAERLAGVAAARHAALDPARVRRDGRLRRRQLLVVDGEHLVLLSRAAARASRSASTPPAATSASRSRSCSCRS